MISFQYKKYSVFGLSADFRKVKESIGIYSGASVGELEGPVESRSRLD